MKRILNSIKTALIKVGGLVGGVLAGTFLSIGYLII